MLAMIFEYVSAVFPFYRASEDAGMAMIDQKLLAAYLEAFLIEKGKL